jgi:hypothetical protein
MSRVTFLFASIECGKSISIKQCIVRFSHQGSSSDFQSHYVTRL